MKNGSVISGLLKRVNLTEWKRFLTEQKRFLSLTEWKRLLSLTEWKRFLLKNKNAVLAAAIAAAMLGVLVFSAVNYRSATVAFPAPEPDPIYTLPPASGANNTDAVAPRLPGGQVRPTALPSTPTPAPTEPPAMNEILLTADVFTDGRVIAKENSYQTKDVAAFFSVTLEDRNAITGRRLMYYIVDIYVRDIESLRCGLADDTPGLSSSVASIKRLAERNGAIAAISGDYTARQKDAYVVRNGVTLRTAEDPKRDVAVLCRDGRLLTLEVGSFTQADILALDPWHVWNFGPALLGEDGRSKEVFNSNVAARNTRAAIGYFEPGHYCFVLISGLQKSEGLTLRHLSQFMEALGCAAAYNLDGGHTAQLYWDGQVLSATRNPRNIHDIIYLTG